MRVDSVSARVSSCGGLILLGLLSAVWTDAGICGEIEESNSPMILELRGRLEMTEPANRAALISDFVESNSGRFPLVEDSLVTFVYRGRVGLRACVPSDLNRWGTRGHEMRRLNQADLYYITLKLPMDARIDYKFYVDGSWRLDPLNSRTMTGGFGPNSEVSMPLYEPPKEIQPVDSTLRGAVEVHEFESTILTNTRKIHVYLPRDYRPLRAVESRCLNGGGTESKDLGFAGSYPVVFVQDGGEYIMLASMVNVLDNLVSEKLIPPTVGVFIDPVDRNREYYLNLDYERMVVEEIMPLIRQRYDVAADPAKTAIMGASLGGALSVMIAMDHPEIFGKCGSQSGDFEVNEGELLKMVGAASRRPVDFYLDCGMFGDLTAENRSMRDILAERGYEFCYQEFNEGHSWGNWRAHIDDMLIFFWGRREKSDDKPRD
jgi:enterochelin esterase-like enzyme